MTKLLMTIAAGQDRVEYFLIASLNTVSPKLVFDKSIYLCVTDGNPLTAVFSPRYWFKTEHFKDSEVWGRPLSS